MERIRLGTKIAINDPSKALTAAEGYRLGQDLSQLSQETNKFPDDILVRKRAYTYSAQNISDAGKLVGNSGAARILYYCEPNTRYKISNPYGGILRVIL